MDLPTSSHRLRNNYQRPYESIAFQFSHHEMQKNGSYTHKTEFLFSTPGDFPNFEFIRALKAAVGATGSIFRYTAHENTILNQIHDQLDRSSEPDRADLSAFIESITRTKGKTKGEADRIGPRSMIDLFDLLKKYYYDPSTRGSNSLKAVFPAILDRSPFLQNKYSSPVYGTDQIPSRNFSSKAWITRDPDGKIVSPYRTLQSILAGYTFEEAERVFSNEELREGGSASIAFARMQFEDMTEKEREAIRAALLRYCELDTLAMVMLVEHWQEITNHLDQPC